MSLFREMGHEVVDSSTNPNAINEDFDICIAVHKPVLFPSIIKLVKQKKNVYYRTIGQSTPGLEQEIAGLRRLGVKIVRMSPNEKYLPNYAGEDYIIRFYKDSKQWTGWTGETNRIIGFGKKVGERPIHLSYDIFREVTNNLPRAWIGTHNQTIKNDILHEEIQELNLISKLAMQRCILSTGTFPSPYTLGQIETLMIGLPTICIGENLWYNRQNPYKNLYEWSSIIIDGVNGFVSDNITYLRSKIIELINDIDYARFISNNGRKTAIQLFDKQIIKNKWNQLFNEV